MNKPTHIGVVADEHDLAIGRQISTQGLNGGEVKAEVHFIGQVDLQAKLGGDDFGCLAGAKTRTGIDEGRLDGKRFHHFGGRVDALTAALGQFADKIACGPIDCDAVPHKIVSHVCSRLRWMDDSLILPLTARKGKARFAAPPSFSDGYEALT